MTSFLYYSISSNLTENEIYKIDKQVFRNREFVYTFLTKLSLNSKRKAKTLCLYIA